MVNKAKKQGTTYETNIVNRLNKNRYFKSQRFAEGGSNDLGDVQLLVGDEEYFIEAKSRQNLNIHQSLDKAIDKSGSEDVMYVADNNVIRKVTIPGGVVTTWANVNNNWGDNDGTLASAQMQKIKAIAQDTSQ